jgi:hypothetical protein
MIEDLHPAPPRLPAQYILRDQEGNIERPVFLTFSIPRLGELIYHGERIFKIVRVIHSTHTVSGYGNHLIITPTIVGIWFDRLNLDSDLSDEDYEEVERMLRQCKDPEE